MWHLCEALAGCTCHSRYCKYKLLYHALCLSNLLYMEYFATTKRNAVCCFSPAVPHNCNKRFLSSFLKKLCLSRVCPAKLGWKMRQIFAKLVHLLIAWSCAAINLGGNCFQKLSASVGSHKDSGGKRKPRILCGGTRPRVFHHQH